MQCARGSLHDSNPSDGPAYSGSPFSSRLKSWTSISPFSLTSWTIVLTSSAVSWTPRSAMTWRHSFAVIVPSPLRSNTLNACISSLSLISSSSSIPSCSCTSAEGWLILLATEATCVACVELILRNAPPRSSPRHQEVDQATESTNPCLKADAMSCTQPQHSLDSIAMPNRRPVRLSFSSSMSTNSSYSIWSSSVTCRTISAASSLVSFSPKLARTLRSSLTEIVPLLSRSITEKSSLSSLSVPSDALRVTIEMNKPI
mmetsp:Transcript_100811/g.285772  ORF Transcript_100811/g.285772 Transcript_100811/m.285772 type:complete len:258 (-) Transcript_100811:67-840(-)